MTQYDTLSFTLSWALIGAAYLLSLNLCIQCFPSCLDHYLTPPETSISNAVYASFHDPVFSAAYAIIDIMTPSVTLARLIKRGERRR